VGRGRSCPRIWRRKVRIERRYQFDQAVRAAGATTRAVLVEIFGGDVPAAGAEKEREPARKVKAENRASRQPVSLSRLIPGGGTLTRTRAQNYASPRGEGRWTRAWRCAARYTQSGAPGNGGAPIMSSEKDFFLARVHRRCDGRRRRAQAWQYQETPAGFAAQVVPALVRGTMTRKLQPTAARSACANHTKIGIREQNDHGRILRPGGKRRAI